MHSSFNSATLEGVDVRDVIIEVNASKKGHEKKLVLVGMADVAVKESKERVKSAIMASSSMLPQGESIISLAPADRKKAGGLFDLPIALALIACQENIITSSFNDILIVGELSLDGKVRSIKGALAIALYAKQNKFKAIMLPYSNAQEASLVEGISIYAISHLQEAINFLKTKEITPIIPIVYQAKIDESMIDFADIKGQYAAKRGLEVAGAGAHNILLVGPPGCGKSMLAKAYVSILPKLSLEETLEVSKIHSIAGCLEGDMIQSRPFRQPHHTISDVGLFGGTSNLIPGELTLAHKGVLFLDELPEYKRSTLEVLRQPLEEKKLIISRAKGSAQFPADFSLLAAMNPCPCGYYGSNQKECRCPHTKRVQYRNKISGPLLDRIDIHLQLNALTKEQLLDNKVFESSKRVQERVQRARDIQTERFGTNTKQNAHMTSKDLKKYCLLDDEAKKLLSLSIEELSLSARAHDRILKIARTLADLEGASLIKEENICEAIYYRSLDRKLW